MSAGSHRKEKAPVASTKLAGHAWNSHPLTATSRAGVGEISAINWSESCT